MKLDFLKAPQRDFLSEGNYHVDQTIEKRFQDVVNRVRDYEKKGYPEGLADRIQYLLENNIFSQSTPCLANFGKYDEFGDLAKNLSASCNIVTVGNSIHDIYSCNLEVAMLSKRGAGVGAGFSYIVDKGTKLDQSFYSNSKLDWVRAIIDTSQKVAQNGVRRGYATPFISIEDPEASDLYDAVDKNNPNKFDVLVDNTIGIKIPTGFMDKLDANDTAARSRWLDLLKVRKKSGQAYVSFVENMNKNCSDVYKALGLEISETNICCVTGDQLVATEDGFKTVEELSIANVPLKLFDNESTHSSTAMLYRGHAPVFKITLRNGMHHTITSNHELVIQHGRNSVQLSIDTGLKVGQKAMVQTNKGLFGKRNEPGLAFLLGLFLGDGCNTGKNGSQLSLWENDFDLIEEVESICEEFYNRKTTTLHHSSQLPKFNYVSTGDSDVRRQNLNTSMFNRNGFEFRKGFIPDWIWKADEETHWQLLRGMLCADGTVGAYNKGKSYGDPINLTITSIDLELLRQLQLIGTNLGLSLKIYSHREEGSMFLPKNDGTGNYKEYATKETNRLVLSNKNDLLTLNRSTKFLDRKNVTIIDREYRDNSQKYSEIMSIEYVGKEDVYCPTVDSDKHLWICNGLVTSNTEFIQPYIPGYTPVCVIGALNLIHWDYIKTNPQCIKDIIYFLNILNDEYEMLTATQPGLEKAHASARDRKDIGLGTLGLHSLFQSKNMAFGDIGSRRLNKEIYSTMQKYALEATEELADLLGPCLFATKAGLNRRNSSLMMVAPNKSSSFFCTIGDTDVPVSPGVEAYFSNIFTKKLANIQYVLKNPYLETLLETKGKNTFDIWESISENLGSVQHLDFLSEDEKLVFLTMPEISPKDIIDLAADRQEFIDMGQSINLVNRPNYTLKDFHQIHKYAFDKGLKTLYYMYPAAHAVLERDGDAWDACVSCAD